MPNLQPDMAVFRIPNCLFMSVGYNLIAFHHSRVGLLTVLQTARFMINISLSEYKCLIYEECRNDNPNIHSLRQITGQKHRNYLSIAYTRGKKKRFLKKHLITSFGSK